MTEYLPWLVLGILLACIGTWGLRRALRRGRAKHVAQHRGTDTALDLILPLDDRVIDERSAAAQADAEATLEAQATVPRLEAQRQPAQAASSEAAAPQRQAELAATRRLEAERAQATEQARLQAQAAKQARQAAAVEQARQKAAVAAAQQEAERLKLARLEAERVQALQAEQAREAAIQAAAAAAAEQARLQVAAQREAERAEALRLLALQVEQAQRVKAEATTAAADKAQRDEAERQLTEQARLAVEEATQLQALAEAEAVALPTTPVPPAPAVKARTPAETLVLVADDSKVVRVKTSRLLIKHGYQVTLAEDGDEAARHIAQTPPHVLITDVEMPGMDGFELSRHVRGLPHMAHIPIIMVTAAEDKHASQAALVGVSVLLGKPYLDEELLAHVESSLTQGIERNNAEWAVR